MDRPQQRQHIISVPCRNRGALLRQMIHAAPFLEERFDALAQGGVSVSFLGGDEDLAENSNQGFFKALMAFAQIGELLLRGGLGSTDSDQKHFSEFVTASRFGLVDQAQQKGAPLVGATDIEQLTDFQCRRFGGELAQLRKGNVSKYGRRVRQFINPSQTFRPIADIGRPSRTRRVLKSIKGCDARLWVDDKQGVQNGGLIRRQSFPYLAVNAAMDLGAHVVDDSVQGAERWQIYVGSDQGLDCAIDEVGRIAHRCGGGESRLDDDLFAGFAIGRYGKMRSDQQSISMQDLPAAHDLGRLRQTKLSRHMRTNGVGDIRRREKQAKGLAGPKQHGKRQLVSRPPGCAGDERAVRYRQFEFRNEFDSRQSFVEPRIGRALNGRHEVSKKGFAVGPFGTLNFLSNMQGQSMSINDYIIGRGWA